MSGAYVSGNETALGSVLDKVSDFISEIHKNLDSISSIMATATTVTATISTPQQINSATATITGDATGCLSAQSLYSSCSEALKSSTADDDYNKRQITSQPYRRPFDNAGLFQQASCLCYTTPTTKSMATQVDTRYDGWISQCSQYLKTASLPAYTTMESNGAVLTAAPAQSAINKALGQYGSVQSIESATPSSSTIQTSMVPTPTSGAVKNVGGVMWEIFGLILLLHFNLLL